MFPTVLNIERANVNINQLKYTVMINITQESVQAFVNAVPFKKGNTEVQVHHDEVFFYLHGNMIAHKFEGGLYVTTCGWRSNVTKERLNGILHKFELGKIIQKDFVWYLDNEEFHNKRFEF